MHSLLKDLRHALRQLRRNPGFAVTSLLTLALGIGAVTTIFSVIRAVVFQPLPYPDSDRLVMLWSQNLPAGVVRAGTGHANIVDWRNRARTFSEMAVVDGFTATLSRSGEQARRVSAVLTSPELFSVLGIGPVLGRVPTAEEAEKREPLAVISHALWQQMGGTPDVLGSRFELDGRLFTVVGVLSAGIAFPTVSDDIWIPLAFARAWDTERFNRGTESLRVIARLAPGVSLDAARTEMNGIAEALRREHPAQNKDLGVELVPLPLHVTGPKLRLALTLLATAVAAVLLIACSNVANLLLARGLARQREFAVRLSLGATRGRLIAQILTENLVLGLLAAAIGAGLAWLALPVIRAFGPGDIPRLGEVKLDGVLLALSTAVSLACTVLSGLAPAFNATRRDPLTMLRDGGRGSTEGRHGRRVRAALVVLEFALASGLLAGAGLLIASFARLLAVDPGFRPDGVLVVVARMPLPRPESDFLPYLRQLQERVSVLPGVIAAGAAEEIMLGERRDVSVTIDGMRGPGPEEMRLPIGVDAATPGFFEAMGISLRNGRLFNQHDLPGGQPVVIVNETLAARLWPGENPVGKRMRLGAAAPETPWLEVVGVIADTHRQGLDRRPIGQAYRPFGQSLSRGLGMAIRTAGDPAALVAPIRAISREIDPGVRVDDITTLQRSMAERMAARRFQTGLLGAFAAVALVLASIGIFGLMHYSVVRRTHEIGIRMALGADPAGVRRMIVREGLGLALTGVAAGTIAAIFGLRGIASLLFEVKPYDPVVFGSAAGVLLLVALAASWLPARRASRIDPNSALRAE